MNKPMSASIMAVSARSQIMVAAIMWTIVGSILFTVGIFWVLSGNCPYFPIQFTVVVCLGLLKARYVLKRTVNRIVNRIKERGDGKCIGGFISWQTWLFVLFMMVIGRILRSDMVPRVIVGLIYIAVGTALFTSALRIWRIWYTQ